LLEHYAGRFSAVEIDNSFYRLPAAETLAHWRAATPADFAFTCKANRYITHMKKLKEPERTLTPFLEGLAPLGDKLKVVVCQLPPRWRCNPARLEAFLAALPPRPRFAFEFRDDSWHDPAVYAALARRNAAFCICDLGGRQSPYKVTADFVYLRLHGPSRPYEGAYSPQRLAGLARRIRAWRAEGRDCFVFFDNDAEGQAPLDALRLRAMLEKR
jgi:uncharacterized protein YecE (DUF72 family)